MTPNEAVREHLSLVTRLTRELDTLPAEVLAQEYQYESFGSWYMVVKRKGQHFRIDFDGKDRVLLAYRVVTAGERFTRPPELIGEHSLEHGLTQETLDNVYSFLTRVTAGGAE